MLLPTSIAFAVVYLDASLPKYKLISSSPARLFSPWIGFVWRIPEVSIYIPKLVASEVEPKFLNPNASKSNVVIPDGDVTVIAGWTAVDKVAVFILTIGIIFPFTSVTVADGVLGGTFTVTPPTSFMSSAVATFIVGVEVPFWFTPVTEFTPSAFSSTFSDLSVQIPALFKSEAAIFIVP